jgi:predicted ATPase
MFYVIVFDEFGHPHDLENVKIGFRGQDTSASTRSKLPDSFDRLPEGFFSLGTSVEYYHKIANSSSGELQSDFLVAMRDIVANPEILETIKDEPVFSISLLRDVSLTSVKNQFSRVLVGGAIRTNFSFIYAKQADSSTAGIELSFDVDVDSTPQTNVHALIGRNGIGKTTILNGITKAIHTGHTGADAISQFQFWGQQRTIIAPDFFSSVVLVSFSAFDPFDPPPEQPDPSKGTCFFYVGLKSKGEDAWHELKRRDALKSDFIAGMRGCLRETHKRNRWRQAFITLQSDENFAGLGFERLLSLSGEEWITAADEIFSNLSSGHSIVLLTITKLVERVEEKTLVLMDEPESHLHPPLLSALIRALSELLLDRNGVAIVATHSPVVLQEIPASCVWKIHRSNLVASAQRPTVETFGENVGILTREVFGLEVASSGFHTLLAAEAAEGHSFDAILRKFGGRLGLEGQAVLRALIAERDSKGQA